MKMDIKILKIGLLATAAILAPVATMMIQYELREDDQHDFEGEIELANTETETGILSEKIQVDSKPVAPAKTSPKQKAGTGRRRNTFRKLEDCLKAFPRCRSKSKKKTFDRKQAQVNWAKPLISRRGENPFISKLKIV